MLYPLATVEVAVHISEIKPGQVVIRCFSCRQFESKVRSCRKCMTVTCEQLHPPGRPLQKRDWTHEHGAKSRQNRKDNSEMQSHVVIERQPGHHTGVRWGNSPVVPEEGGIDLLEIGHNVFVRNHNPGGGPGRSGSVLQIRGVC